MSVETDIADLKRRLEIVEKRLKSKVSICWHCRAQLPIGDAFACQNCIKERGILMILEEEQTEISNGKTPFDTVV